jgi:hypothetical protein
MYREEKPLVQGKHAERGTAPLAEWTTQQRRPFSIAANRCDGTPRQAEKHQSTEGRRLGPSPPLGQVMLRKILYITPVETVFRQRLHIFRTRLLRVRLESVLGLLQLVRYIFKPATN